MGRFKIYIVNGAIIGCKEVTKRSNPHDFIQINQLEKFVQYDELLRPKAYLCKAASEAKAMEFANDYLNSLRQNEIARSQTG
jgi:hypothetical protein